MKKILIVLVLLNSNFVFAEEICKVATWTLDGPSSTSPYYSAECTLASDSIGGKQMKSGVEAVKNLVLKGYEVKSGDFYNGILLIKP